jgi:hypothetical protein
MQALAIGWLGRAAVVVAGSAALAGCGARAVAPARSEISPAADARADGRTAARPRRAPVDPIAALAPDDAGARSWVVPGPILLELGGTPVSVAGSGRPIEVVPIDRQGNLERVAVQLEHARFSVWIDRARMLAVMQRDHRVQPLGPPVGGDVELVLRAGAVVQRLAHRDHATQIRFRGALEVETWVPDAAIADRGPPRASLGRVPTGLPGAVIRAEPKWAAGELALMGTGSFLDTIRDVDEAWSEVSYEDGDLRVHGFVSRRDPPGRLHHWPETDGTPTIAPSATVASGTCLYARIGGEPIGYVVGDRPVELDEAPGASGTGWWALAIDTPWGPLELAARGPSKTELAACAPAGSVPPPVAAPPSP